MFFDKNKQALFPNIKDWSSNQNHLRHANVRDLKYDEWFFFHPSAYKLFTYAMYYLAIFFNTITFLLAIKYDLTIIKIICLLLICVLAYKLSKKLYNRKSEKDLTLYDLYMRE